jgi:hypothetical protein
MPRWTPTKEMAGFFCLQHPLIATWPPMMDCQCNSSPLHATHCLLNLSLNLSEHNPVVHGVAPWREGRCPFKDRFEGGIPSCCRAPHRVWPATMHQPGRLFRLVQLGELV